MQVLVQERFAKILEYSHDNFLYDNAVFYAGRLESMQSSEESKLSLAKAFFVQAQYKNVYYILKKSKSAMNRYLFAHACYHLGFLAEAETVLLGVVESIQREQGVGKPDLAAVYYMLGKTCQRANRTIQAIGYFKSSLKLNPLIFDAYEQLCRLGSLESPKEIFVEKAGQTNLSKSAFLSSIHSGIGTPLKNSLLDFNMENTPTNNSSSSLNNLLLAGSPNSGISRRKEEKSRRLRVFETPDSSVRRSSRLNLSKGHNYVREKKRIRPLSSKGESEKEISENNNSDSDYRNDEILQQVLNLLQNFGYVCQYFYSFQCRKAIKVIQEMEHEHQQSGWVLSYLGKSYFEMVEYLKAEKCFELLRTKEPWHLNGMEIYSTLLWHLQKDSQLSFLANELYEFNKKAPQTWCAIGNCFSLQKDHNSALKAFQRAIQLDPFFAYPFTLSGHENVSVEDFEKATFCFQNALRIDSRHYNAWYGLGMIYFRQEKFEMAEFHFLRATKINPNNSVLFCYLGMIMQASKKTQKALEMFEKATKIDPKNPLAKFKKARLFSLIDQPQKALQELFELREITPNESAVYLQIGKIYKNLGDTQKSTMYFTWAYDLDPKCSSATSNDFSPSESLDDAVIQLE
ncbi:TPR-like protein [Rozella allomycis CSF55]|uniref:TPR-like protein n=1 Tax=Rozella allomycis (strain CSF55) TaxID=988480 RepID=A0A4P9YMQ0_ROZAC|nr:TPR-like protein [Rozella allomycis CSF55]